MNKKEFIKLVSKIDQTFEDEFKAAYNSPELIWEKVVKNLARKQFKGWTDENVESPKKDGDYLCLVKYIGYKDYIYEIVFYSKKEKWQVDNTCKHILWTELFPSPFN
jgi:hypothetical protein